MQAISFLKNKNKLMIITVFFNANCVKKSKKKKKKESLQRKGVAPSL